MAGGEEAPPGGLWLPPGVTVGGGGAHVALRRGDRVLAVRRGDTLWELAAAHGVPVEALVRSNGGSEAIAAGARLVIPRGAVLAKRTGGPGRADPGNGRGKAGRIPFWHRAFEIREDVDHFQRHPEMRRLFSALRMVETSNIYPAPVGDNGDSIGPLQIGRPYHRDAWSSCLSARDADQAYEKVELIPHAERTAIKYWMRYVPWALHFGDHEALARTHNGGPNWTKSKTKRYWRKVRGEMNQYDFRHNPHLRRWAHHYRINRHGLTHVPLEARTLFAFDPFSRVRDLLLRPAARRQAAG